MKADGRERRGTRAGPKTARDKADSELFWLAVAVVCALLVGLRRSSPAIRDGVADWWDRWSATLLVIALVASSVLAAVLVLHARRRYRRRVAEAEAEAATRRAAPAIEREPLPQSVDLFVDLPPADGGVVLRYAVGEGGAVIGWTLDGPDAHGLVIGPSGSGKTNLLQVLAVEATRQGVEVVAADPKRVDLLGLRNWPGVSWVAGDVGQIAELVTAVHAEMDRRLALIEARAERRERPRPGELPPILVLLDELPLLGRRLDAEWEQRRRETDPRRHPALGLLTEVATLGRPANVHLVVTVDRPDDDVLGPMIRGQIRHLVSLGALSPEAPKPLSDGAEVAAERTMPPGRGMSTITLGTLEVQCVKVPDLNQWSEFLSNLRPARPSPSTLAPSDTEPGSRGST